MYTFAYTAVWRSLDSVFLKEGDMDFSLAFLQTMLLYIICLLLSLFPCLSVCATSPPLELWSFIRLM